MGLNADEREAETRKFQSTHPVWDGTQRHLPSVRPPLFQSTHPVWDGTKAAGREPGGDGISIHPSRVGWDTKPTNTSTYTGISIHPSRVGWD